MKETGNSTHIVRGPWLAVLVAALLLGGCRGDSEDEPPVGSFEALVQGVLDDTLQGVATYQTDADGRLASLELGARDSTEGLSLELEPLAAGERVYAVPQRRPGGEAPAVRVYLDVREHSFIASDGTLHVETASPRRLEGTFEFRMEAPVEVPFDESQPVTVRGRFDAAPAPSSDPDE